ncbi:aspartyl-tRNA(Asn) amidotransferase, B subunit [Pyrolobus fumarii 1A]|uniref:Glutamyl-tRNA(Gln) amidotransferase subunit E n=1 Tax=Pyrolobus fumarii (strain DSM 11204 / 1A) TaxID=694429 RepID=G0EEK4_PYRF1|nr:Glu-tRNA(Gln) amidotransferase subunit GatE [Pyrolobus fumarii]AEM38826.1 aspartyl-tRNA(Asn) amidotransferase, B subunit [Pyrolobus fumarii 1A]
MPLDPKARLEELDFSKLGLKVGLEIHQQLATQHKLFCKCPAELVEEDAEDVFPRRLRPTRSELGEVDIAALFEWRKGRVYEYHAPRTASCLVEADEEPPHPLNEEALKIALAIALALGAKPVDEVHVMRKIVIDGSNTTGFQRTAVIALGGHITLSNGKRVGIQTICLEEDAARKLGEEGVKTKYRLDRLGIPLIEVSTAPDLNTPEEAQEAAYVIGQLFRLTGRVRRGIGTIRQDLNISIEGGAKVEIKGVQRLDLIAKVVAYEALRQYRLLQIRDELKARGLKPEDLDNIEIIDVTDVFRNTKSKVIKRALSRGGRVLAVKLPGFHGILGVEVQPGRRFGTELADYARFWGGVGGIFHTDELPAYGITSEEVEKLYEVTGARKGYDAIVIVADEEKKARKALEAVIERAKQALVGVPRETRAALDDGTTRYMRPQPGAARMYPETDIPPMEVTEEILREAEKLVPEPPAKKLERFVREYGLSEELAKQVIRDIHLDVFERLVEKYKGKVPATLIAYTLVSTLKNLRHEGVPVDNISDEHLDEVFGLVAQGKIAKEAIPDVLKYLAEHPGSTVKEAIEKLGLGAASLEEVQRVVDEVVEQLRSEILERGERVFGKIMGRVMARLRGRADGRVVAEIVKKKIREVLGSQ